MSRRLLFFAVVSAVPLLAQVQDATGVIAGTILDGEGRPLRGAYVTITREGAKVGEATPARLGTGSGAGGVFRFAGLVAGKYLICAAADPGLELVNVCDWNFRAPSVDLKAGQVVENFSLRMEKGALIEFEIEDAQRVLSHGRGTGTGSLLPGFRGPGGLYVPARLYAFTNGGAIYAVVVPRGKPVRLSMMGSKVEVKDENGTDALQDLERRVGAVTYAVAGGANEKKRYRLRVNPGRGN